MKKLVAVALICCVSFAALAQGRKDIKNAGIKTTTVYKYEYKDGKELKTIDSKTTYDANGNEAEVWEYDDFGKISKHEKNEYNANNDKISVTVYDPSGKVKKVIKSTYGENGKKATESEYDGMGNLKKLSKFSYYGEFKTEKQTFNGTNQLISKKVYTYDK